MFANVASSSGELRQLISSPSGFEDDDILPPDARISCRGALASAWRLAEASFKTKKSSNNEERGALVEAPSDLDRGTRILSRFQDVYRSAIPIYDQPSDRTLSIAHHIWAKRSFEFGPLGAAPAYSGQDSSWIWEPEISPALTCSTHPPLRRRKRLAGEVALVLPSHSQGLDVFVHFGLCARPRRSAAGQPIVRVRAVGLN